MSSLPPSTTRQPGKGRVGSAIALICGMLAVIGLFAASCSESSNDTSGRGGNSGVAGGQ